MPDKPYKFLDYYTLDDASIFFGRERETQILLSDVLVNRLVVLFARTGTGKTSLINAGLRPKLESQGYKTFFIRVNEDPAQSAQAELNTDKEIGGLQGERLAEQLENVVTRLRRPIVLFFDQFEEFFIYVYNKDRARGLKFIEDIAKLYHNDKSGVHVVFSMREEFFVDMDAFRDKIPTIFHNDSNLRLRRFDKNQARDAIVYPARTFKVRLDSDLVDRLLADLSDGSSEDEPASLELGLIEPAQLQIVCDSLWEKAASRRKKEGRITLDDYKMLGGDNIEKNVSRQVLYDRLEQGFEDIKSQDELNLLVRLLPQLRTKEKTKYVRDLEGLGKALETDESSLRELIAKLVKIHFIRRGKRDNVEVIELSHDYLVERLDDLAKKVRAIGPRRTLDQAVDRYTHDHLLASPEEVGAIVDQIENIEPTRTEAEFLFLSSLAHGHYALELFQLAAAKSVDVWGILREKIIDTRDFKEASNSINLLRKVAGQIKGDDQSAAEKISSIFGLLEHALNQDELTSETQETLARLIALQDKIICPTASSLLLKHLSKAVDKERVASPAIVALGRIETIESTELLSRAAKRNDLTLDAQDALVKLMNSQTAEVASHAVNNLLSFYDAYMDVCKLSGPAIQKLYQVQTKQCVAILSKALEREEVADEARFALEKLIKSDDTEIAAAARNAISSFLATEHATSTAEPSSYSNAPSLESKSKRENQAGKEYLSHEISNGECILLIGPGVHLPPPADSKYTYPDMHRPPLGAHLSEYLAEKGGFNEYFPLESRRDLRIVAEHFESQFSRQTLIEELQASVETGKEPSPLIRAIARLPFRVIITTTFDRLLEKALLYEGKKPNVRIVSLGESDIPEAAIDYRGNRPDTPFILKLYGDVKAPESVVITDNDLIEFMLRMMERGPDNPIPIGLRQLFSRWPMLSMGYSLKDFHQRLLFRALLRFGEAVIKPPTYILDLNPDRMVVDVWSNVRRYATFINEDIWSFIPELYSKITGKEL